MNTNKLHDYYAEFERQKKKATHYTKNKNGSVALYYIVDEVKLNTGEIVKRIRYLSSFNIWMGTNDFKEAESLIIPIENINKS